MLQRAACDLKGRLGDCDEGSQLGPCGSPTLCAVAVVCLKLGQRLCVLEAVLESPAEATSCDCSLHEKVLIATARACQCKSALGLLNRYQTTFWAG